MLWMRWPRPTSRAALLPRRLRTFYAKVFAAQGLLVLDAGGREFHRIGAPVLRAALERADELHAAVKQRNGELEAAGYHAQVAVARAVQLAVSDRRSHRRARLALKRIAPSAAEPGGLWQAGRQSYSTSELVGVLDAEPERISPSALLRPVFQDFLLSTSLTIGGPGGDCLLCPVCRALRAHSGPHDAGPAALLRHAH